MKLNDHERKVSLKKSITRHCTYNCLTAGFDTHLVKTISEKTGLPLVMHGGSGVSPEDYRSGIRNGLRKINYYTYMSRAGVSAVKNLLQSEEVTFFHDLALAARKAMESDAEVAMKVFAGIV